MTCLISRQVLLGAVIIWLACLAPQGYAQTIADANRPYRITMWTWNGLTDSGRGFQEHFSRRRIPVEFTILNVQSNTNRLAGITATLSNEPRPDLIYTWGASITEYVVGHVGQGGIWAGVPVIFVNVSDPVRAQIVPSLQNSRLNVTGSLFLVPMRTQLLAMRSYRGTIGRLGTIYDPADQDAQLVIHDLRSLAGEFNYQLLELPIGYDQNQRPDPASLAELVARASRVGVDFLYFPPDAFLAEYRQQLGNLTLSYRIPTFAASESVLQDSSIMMGVIVPHRRVGQVAALQAERILVNGERAQALPIQNLLDFALMLNMDTVRQLRLYPPLQLLGLAQLVSSTSS